MLEMRKKEGKIKKEKRERKEKFKRKISTN